MAKLISAIYGDALFETAVEKKIVDLLREEVELLKDIWTGTSDLPLLLNSPRLTMEEKKNVLKEVFGSGFSTELMGLLTVLTEYERQNEVPAVCDYFLEAANQYRGVGNAFVTSAVSLTRDQKARIEARLLDTTGFRFLEIRYQVDGSLIGGIVIRMGDRVVDGSVKTRLDGLQHSLLNARIKEPDQVDSLMRLKTN